MTTFDLRLFTEESPVRFVVAATPRPIEMSGSTRQAYLCERCDRVHVEGCHAFADHLGHVLPGTEMCRVDEIEFQRGKLLSN